MIHLYGLSGTSLSEGKALTGHRGALTALTYSPDGQYLASADHNRDIFVWDVKSGAVNITHSFIHFRVPKIFVNDFFFNLSEDVY